MATSADLLASFFRQRYCLNDPKEIASVERCGLGAAVKGPTTPNSSLYGARVY